MCPSWFSRFVSPFSLIGDQNPRILLMGLDAAGKTTIFYKLKLYEDVTTVPTIGFNVDTVTVEDVALTVWDVSGQERVRDLWRYYYKGSDGLLFVVDSSDIARLAEAKQELMKIISHKDMTKSCPVVFTMKLQVLLATLFVVILLQNEVSAKSNEYKRRSADDEDEGHFDAKERNIDLKKDDLEKDAGDFDEHEDDDIMEDERDAPKKSPFIKVSWRRRVCYTIYRRRVTYCH